MNVNMLLSGSSGSNGSPVYLLDIYTNSTSAVSLRKLKTGALNCCEIRRSSDNATTIIYLESSGQITLSSTVSAGGTLASWIGSDDGFLRTWYDQSGNGNDFQQTVEPLQWKLLDNGSFVLDNNGNVAFFNDTGSKDLETNTDLSSGGNATIFGVFEIPSVETVGLLYSQIGVNNVYAATWNSASDTPDFLSGTCNYYTNGVLLNPKTRVNLYSSIAIDEPVMFTTYIGDSTSYSNLEITGYDSSLGDTILKSNEYIIFNNDQSANQSAIEANINDFYFQFSPLDLSPNLWLDATDSSTITTTGLDVDQWDDKSGFGNNVLSGTDKPTNDGDINGFNAINWGDSTNSKALRFSTGANTDNWQDVYVVGRWDGFMTFGNDFNSFNGLVTGSTSTGSGMGVGLIGDSGDDFFFFNFNWYDNLYLNGIAISVGEAVLGVPNQINDNFVLSFSSDTEIGVDGITIGNDRDGTFSGRSWLGNIGEVIAFPRKLSDSERNQLTNYLNNKWGI